MPSPASPVDDTTIRPSGPRAHIPAGERLYVIGDIHGRLDLLAALVARIRDDDATRGPARVRVVLLGDLIDRGLESAGVVETCRSLASRSAGFVVLKGNHEAMLVAGVRGNFNAFALWLRHGGDAALASWGADPAILAGGATPALVHEARRRIPAETIGWLDGLPTSHLAGDYLFVHAGIRPDVPLAGQSVEDMLWIRGPFLDSEAAYPFVVVHGHSITESGVVIRPNRIGIDTGAYRSDVLTALGLEGGRRWTLATGLADARADAADGERIEADIAAILGDDERADDASPARRAWPRAGMAAVALAGAASLAAVALVRGSPAPPAPVVQRYDLALPGKTAPGGARVAVPPAPAAVRAVPTPPAAGARVASADRHPPARIVAPARPPDRARTDVAAGPAIHAPEAMPPAEATFPATPYRAAGSIAATTGDR